MTEKRHLSAIVFSDIVGYSRMMGEDENRALRILAEHNEIVPAIIRANDGHVLKFIGDAVLASFDSASDAVKAATDIQNRLAARNQQRPPEEKLLVRIGIHIGDVVLRDGDVFGDGVNIAARIEPLAEPGGICISQTVYDMVRARPEIRTVSLGPRELKNISDKIQIYKVLVEAETEGAVLSPSGRSLRLPGAGRRLLTLAAALVLVPLVLAGVVHLVAPGGLPGLLFGNNLVILSQPSGADVFETGKTGRVGRTPYFTSRPPGTYSFSLQLDEHHPAEVKIEIQGEESVERQVTLLPLLNVAVDTVPTGATLDADGERVCESTPCRIRLDRGSHRIVARQGELQAHSSLWVAKDGQPRQLALKLARPTARRPAPPPDQPRMCSEYIKGVKVYRPCD